MTEEKALVAVDNSSVFQNITVFEDGQRMAKMLASSDLVPAQFKGNLANAVIALEMSQRLGASPLAVMQSIYIVHGKPSWSASFIIAALNSCGRFAPLRFEVTGEGDDKACTAWTYDKGNNERLDGPPVSIAMAKKEGWFSKGGSKWQTMPELMLRYRAATFFGRLYAPDILMGMRTAEEMHDMGRQNIDTNGEVAGSKADILNAEIIETAPEKPADEKPKKPASKPKKEASDKTTSWHNLLSEAKAKKDSLELDKWRMKHAGRIHKELANEEDEQRFFSLIEDMYREMKVKEAEAVFSGK